MKKKGGGDQTSDKIVDLHGRPIQMLPPNIGTPGNPSTMVMSTLADASKIAKNMGATSIGLVLITRHGGYVSKSHMKGTGDAPDISFTMELLKTSLMESWGEAAP